MKKQEKSKNLEKKIIKGLLIVNAIMWVPFVGLFINSINEYNKSKEPIEEINLKYKENSFYDAQNFRKYKGFKLM